MVFLPIPWSLLPLSYRPADVTFWLSVLDFTFSNQLAKLKSTDATFNANVPTTVQFASVVARHRTWKPFRKQPDGNSWIRLPYLVKRILSLWRLWRPVEKKCRILIKFNFCTTINTGNTFDKSFYIIYI